MRLRPRSDAAWTIMCAVALLVGYVASVFGLSWWLGVELRVCSALVC